MFTILCQIFACLIGEKPSTWDPMPLDPNGKDVPLHIVDIPSSDAEYNDVKQKFDQTMMGSYRDIVRIQRIQNPALYLQFIARKKAMDKHNPPGHQNERRLFHGTSAVTCPKINQCGFNRSFAGKNGNSQHVDYILNHKYHLLSILLITSAMVLR